MVALARHLTVLICARRLVDELGLHSTLQQYQVPPGDVPQIARLTLRSGEDDPLLPRVVRILENL